MKVLKFSADWCSPCQALKKILEENTFKNVEFVEVNVDYDFDLVSKHAVRSFPTMIVVDENGDEIKRFVGVPIPQELQEWLSE